MGLFGWGEEDFAGNRAGQDRADYVRGYLSYSNKDIREQEYKQQQANKMAALNSKIYGQAPKRAAPAQYEQQVIHEEGPMMPGQERGIMDINQQTAEAQAATPGTKMFDNSIPIEQRMMQFDKDMLGAAMPGFTDQWSKNQAGGISNMGAMARQIQQQKNPDYNKAFFPNGTPNLPYQQYAQKTARAGAGGEGSDRLNFATPEEVAALGYAPGTQVLIDKNRKPYLPPGMNENTAKNTSFFNMMEESEKLEADILDKYPDFSPAETIDATLRGIQAGGGTIQQLIGKAQSPASKAYLTSQMNWIAANRGALSGAAVPEIEVERDLQTYYPQAGDPPEVIAYKKRLRAARKDSIRSTLNMSADQRRKVLSEGADKDYESVKAAKSKPERATSPGKRLTREQWEARKAGGQ